MVYQSSRTAELRSKVPAECLSMQTGPTEKDDNPAPTKKMCARRGHEWRENEKESEDSSHREDNDITPEEDSDAAQNLIRLRLNGVGTAQQQKLKAVVEDTPSQVTLFPLTCIREEDFVKWASPSP